MEWFPVEKKYIINIDCISLVYKFTLFSCWKSFGSYIIK